MGQRGGIGLDAQERVRPCFKNAAIAVFCADDAAKARRLFNERRTNARFIEIVGGGKARNSATDNDGTSYGLNSLTKSTTART